jgi:adenine-specific DNA-methyltransferase
MKPNALSHILSNTEQRRQEATKSLNLITQKSDGQFFTPMALAQLIASTLEIGPQKSFRILDPGAGVGSLTVALVYRLLLENKTKDIEIVAVEKDASVIPFLDKTLKELVKSGLDNNCKINFQIINGDFFSLFKTLDKNYQGEVIPFDLIIMNPPYGKIGNQAPERILCRNFGVDCSNLYSGFVALATRLLKKGGAITAIIPRSFMNGPYFLDFRKDLLKNLELTRIHLFDSRSSLFADTGVLQENVIFSGIKQPQRGKVMVTTSKDHETNFQTNTYNFEQIVLPGDSQMFIRLPSGDETNEDIKIMESLPFTLEDLGLTVSTGRVVDFRVKEFLSLSTDVGQVPLIYPGNFAGGIVEWPLEIKKPQSISKDLNALLLPNEMFVLIKRFSSKEERRRIVAAVWNPEQSSAEFVGFENHLNVIHSNNLGLPKELATGLSYWLNSSMVDKYFRVFSGHTQVNATDLRSMKFPSKSALEKIGKGKSLLLPSQESIDNEINKYLTEEVAVA